jgi:tRNA-2-methylthio-N6-dimethylallyladenosine synthase
MESNLSPKAPLEASLKDGLYIKTFGCQMNEYDSQKIGKLLEDKYELVKTPQDAKLIIINTCSIREKPENKLYSLLGEIKELKALSNKKDVVVGVGGCVAQSEGETIINRASDVNFVFGTHNLSLVPSLVERSLLGHKAQVAINYRDEWEKLPLGFTGESLVSAFVSISRGCNKNCTYCIVPTTRGVEVSRSVDEILKESRIAVHRGAKEIVLLGQTVNSYGRDRVIGSDGKPHIRFPELLQEVAAIPGVKRIRYTSPHPQEVKSDLINLYGSLPALVPHIHLPLQSGSDTILKAMNRNYRRSRFLKVVDELKKVAPEIAITTDIIVGFPGETEEDFLQTLSVMREVKFAASYSFIFSKRPHTVANSMEDHIPMDVKKERLLTLQGLQEELGKKALQKWVGREVEVLIEREQLGERSLGIYSWSGRTPQNFVINVDPKSEKIRPGDIVNVKVTESMRHTLRGIVNVPDKVTY